MAHTLATVIFSAALASAIARAAHAGFAALAAEHERRKHTSTPEEYRALIEFAGDSQAKLDGTLGWLLGGGDGITITLIISGVLALLARAGFEYLLTLSAQKAASGAKSSIRRQLLQRVLATGGADTPEGTGATAVLISRGLDALDNYYTKTLTAFRQLRRSARHPVGCSAAFRPYKRHHRGLHPAAHPALHGAHRQNHA